MPFFETLTFQQRDTFAPGLKVPSAPTVVYESMKVLRSQYLSQNELLVFTVSLFVK